MFYGSWEWICQATSVDGKVFTRVLDNSTGRSTIFSEGSTANTRDPMLFAVEAQPALIVFRIVYSAFPDMAGGRASETRILPSTLSKTELRLSKRITSTSSY